jgi:peptide/nickel transport system permease protein
MQNYILRRVLLLIPTLLIVSTIAFSLVRLMPGDVVVAQLAESPSFHKEDADALRQQLGLDRPWLKQYLTWMGGVLHGDLGKSLWSSKRVSSVIADRIGVTVELALLAFIMANVIALVFGLISAVRQDTPIDYVLRLLSIGGLSVPNFWIATLVIVLGAKYFNYLPPLVFTRLTDDPVANIKQLFLPAAVIAIGSSATIMRMVRSSMLEILRQDYIRTAKAKGLRERKVIYSHALKNALLPVITLQGFQFGVLLTGSLIIETIFGLPGLGRLMYDAVNTRDYPQVQGGILLFGCMFVLINLTVDLLYGWIDPRVKY